MANVSCKTKAKRSISSKLVFTREYGIQRQELQEEFEQSKYVTILSNMYCKIFYETQNEKYKVPVEVADGMAHPWMNKSAHFAAD